MHDTLNEIEGRVLAVLLEKSLAQPTYYPMTLTAVVAGCNQKSNRDPHMDLDDSAVQSTLTELRNRGLVSMALPAPGARVNRFKHEAEGFYCWDKPRRAVMAELLLRGPQTAGELKARCSRMASISSMEAVNDILDTLTKTDPPFVAVLPRAPGQSTIRYTHLLFPEGETAQAAPPGSPADFIENKATDIETRLLALQTEIIELRDTMSDLHRRVAALEDHLA